MKFRLIAAATLAFAITPIIHAQQWTAPTPEELKMTSFSEVPGADAIVLNKEEIDDDDMHVQYHYMRIKVLTEKGLKYADIEVDFNKKTDLSGYTIGEFFARTVQPDGTIVPFTGKGMDKVLEKDAINNYTRRAYTLPAAKVGSILEYRYTIRRDDHWFAPARWSMQGDLYIKNEHFLWKPTDKELLGTTRGGRESVSQRLTWAKSLPAGVDVVQHKTPTGRIQMEATVSDVMPFANEQYMPPSIRRAITCTSITRLTTTRRITGIRRSSTGIPIPISSPGITAPFRLLHTRSPRELRPMKIRRGSSTRT